MFARSCPVDRDPPADRLAATLTAAVQLEILITPLFRTPNHQQGAIA